MKNKEQFSFSTDFQLEVLRFIIKDKDGITALSRIKPGYLTLIEHSVIADALLSFSKKHNRIPGQPILKESINNLLESKNYVDLVTKEDVSSIISLVDNLYNKPLKDGDIIKDKIYKFAAYVEVKNLTESFDLTSFDQYGEYADKISQIIQKSKPEEKDAPLMMVRDTVKRQFDRQANPSVVPTPFRQINDLTNGGGYPKGSIVVLLDKAKARKSFTLINIARAYLSRQRNVLYIDVENGDLQIMERMVQSTLKKTKKEMMSGEYDTLEKKHLRKYKRLGSEFVVKWLPAMVANANDIADVIRDLRLTHGININVLVIDFAGKLASLRKDGDDFERISNVYIDLQNMAIAEDIDCIYTAQHITREGSKHKETKYEENDISGAISIIRNAQAIWGLNSTAEEEENNILRMEAVVQRDGPSFGRALFNMNPDTQRMDEFSKTQRTLYDEQYGAKLDESFKKKEGKKNPNVGKKVEGNGDI